MLFEEVLRTYGLSGLMVIMSAMVMWTLVKVNASERQMKAQARVQEALVDTRAEELKNKAMELVLTFITEERGDARRKEALAGELRVQVATINEKMLAMSELHGLQNSAWERERRELTGKVDGLQSRVVTLENEIQQVRKEKETETAHLRTELEKVKHENEVLRLEIVELRIAKEKHSETTNQTSVVDNVGDAGAVADTGAVAADNGGSGNARSDAGSDDSGDGSGGNATGGATGTTASG